MNIGFPEAPTQKAMERYMDLTARKQSLVAGNLANIDTPAYRTQDFSIELAMRDAGKPEPGLVLRRHDPRHSPGRWPAGATVDAVEVEGLPQRNDLNNVDLDREMLNLSRTAMKFSLVAQIMRAGFRKLQHAISEGK
ncbi:MAG: flagellar basal body rod protein FlgB [Acidobacteria bacterium]|nr:flagellar basal body rod protein FlgB [Acidobacteriota bacterium]MBI3657842.1 flagellar basal body rod protein FlgB [Acidobacteriota bacterium]